MIFQSLAYFKELLVHVGKNFCHLGYRHGGAHACNDVFALSVHKEFAHKALFAGSGVTGERNAGAAIVAHVAECHHLNVYSGAPAVRDVVVHTIDVCTGVVPAAEYSFDSFEELFLGIVGEVFAELSLILCLELVSKGLEVVSAEFYVELNTLFFLHLVDELFEIFFADFHNDVGEHLNESSVAVPSPAGVVGLLGDSVYNFFVKAEVENGVHHAGHGSSCAGTNGYEKGIFLIAELLSADFFHLVDIRHDLCLYFGVDLSAVFIILGAGFGRNGKTLGYGKTYLGHFRKVRAFAA